MLSLRLPPQQDLLITQIAKRLGMSRSAWLRQLIDQGIASQSAADPHALYLQAVAPVQDSAGSGHGTLGRHHSAELKAKLRKKHQMNAG